MRLVDCGNDQYLNLLSVGELSAMSERAWQAKRKQTREMLDDAQASEESAIKELRALYEVRDTRIPAVMYSVTINGSRDIIETACKSQGKSASSIIGEMTFDKMTEVAGLLIGYDPKGVQTERDRGE